uniref:SFRICE_002347 n=1 Tax=Spodoptera frugiperda TaxID=7108 RepID=A0A2H1X3I2_SPOFR
MICSACTNNLQPGDAFLECAAEACNKVYHYLCNNRELTIEERAVWVCPECSCAARKGGRSCEEPIPIHTPLVLKNVSLRNKSNPPLLQSPDNYSTNQEVFLLREQMNVLTEQLIDAMAVITQYQTALADCTKKVEIVCDKLNKLEQSCKCGCAAVCKKVTVTQSEAANIVILEPPQPSQLQENVVHVRNDIELSPVAGANSIHAVADDVINVPSRNIRTSRDQIDLADPVQLVPQQDRCLETHRDDMANSDWVEVRNKKLKRRESNSIRGTARPETTTLKAVEYRKYIHLWNMMSGADEIQCYLQSLCPGANCTVEELKPKGDYKSFKIGVSADYFDKCMSPETWPVNARVRKWLFRGNNSKTQKQERAK